MNKSLDIKLRSIHKSFYLFCETSIGQILSNFTIRGKIQTETRYVLSSEINYLSLQRKQKLRFKNLLISCILVTHKAHHHLCRKAKRFLSWKLHIIALLQLYCLFTTNYFKKCIWSWRGKLSENRKYHVLKSDCRPVTKIIQGHMKKKTGKKQTD